MGGKSDGSVNRIFTMTDSVVSVAEIFLMLSFGLPQFGQSC